MCPCVNVPPDRDYILRNLPFQTGGRRLSLPRPGFGANTPAMSFREGDGQLHKKCLTRIIIAVLQRKGFHGASIFFMPAMMAPRVILTFKVSFSF